jgi:ArsR family transcriptional regulator
MKDSNHDASVEELKNKLDALYDQGVFIEDSEKRLSKLEYLEQEVLRMETDSKIQNVLKLFKALSNKNRLLILWLIMNGIRCACEIEHILSLSQSTVSHHINELIEVGVLKIIKSGKWSLVSSETNIFSEDFFIELIKKI